VLSAAASKFFDMGERENVLRVTYSVANGIVDGSGLGARAAPLGQAFAEDGRWHIEDGKPGKGKRSGAEGPKIKYNQI